MKYLNHSGTPLNLSHFRITNVGWGVYTTWQLLSIRNKRLTNQPSLLTVSTSRHSEVVYFFLNLCTICTFGGSDTDYYLYLWLKDTQPHVDVLFLVQRVRLLNFWPHDYHCPARTVLTWTSQWPFTALPFTSDPCDPALPFCWCQSLVRVEQTLRARWRPTWELPVRWRQRENIDCNKPGKWPLEYF